MRHSLFTVLSLAVTGVLAGCRSLTAIWEHTTDLTPSDLRSLGLETGQALPSAVIHPAGAAGPGPHRPQHPSEVVVVHSYRHRRGKNSHRGGRQDRARGPPGAGLGAAPPVGPGPRHGCRAAPGPGSGQVQPEIPAIRELLQPLDLDGVVVTADAMHTQVDTAQWIRDQGGHYVLTVKGNQKTLRRTLKDLPWKKVPSISSVDTGHGWRVRRTVMAVQAPKWVDFPGAAQVVQVRRTRTTKDRRSAGKNGGGSAKRTTVEVVYLVCSLPMGQAQPEQVAAWVRGHWKIKNWLHVGP